MAKEKKNVEQPELESQQILSGIMNDSDTEEVVIRGKKWRVKDLHYFSLLRMTDVLLKEKDEQKVIPKCVAMLYLDKTKYFYKLFYWLVWRWFHYVRCYTPKEFLPFLVACKKKVQVEEYAIDIMLLTGMKTTMMTMTRAEVERIQAEQLGGQHGHSQKNTTD